jgi:hypothetical protein
VRYEYRSGMSTSTVLYSNSYGSGTYRCCSVVVERFAGRVRTVGIGPQALGYGRIRTRTLPVHPCTHLVPPRIQLIHPRTFLVHPRTLLVHPRTLLVHPRTRCHVTYVTNVTYMSSSNNAQSSGSVRVSDREDTRFEPRLAQIVFLRYFAQMVERFIA